MKYINWGIVGLICFALSFISLFMSACFIGTMNVVWKIVGGIEALAGGLCYIVYQKTN